MFAFTIGDIGMEDNQTFSEEFLDEMYEVICNFYGLPHNASADDNMQKARDINRMRKPYASLSEVPKEVTNYVQGEIMASDFISALEKAMLNGDISFAEFAECVNECGGFPIYFTEAMLKLISKKGGV